jgi:hypothetical protein
VGFMESGIWFCEAASMLEMSHKTAQQ